MYAKDLKKHDDVRSPLLAMDDKTIVHGGGIVEDVVHVPGGVNVWFKQNDVPFQWYAGEAEVEVYRDGKLVES